MTTKSSKYARLEDYPEDEATDLHDADATMTYFTEVSKTWHHVENLDDFFKRVYLYHQRNGFLCIVTSEIFSLCQFLFVVFLSTLLIECIDYPLLFADSQRFYIPASNQSTVVDWPTKVKLSEVLYPLDQCLFSETSSFMQLLLLLALLFWLCRFGRALIVVSQFWETRSFYQYALLIPSSELANYTWFDVLDRLKQVQCDQQMCIHKRELTSLDIYSRILRFKNYEIAMINKDILPVRFYIPCFGQYTFLSQGLKFNFALILFWGPGAPFSNNWSLREVYKRKSARIQLANELSRRIILVGLINLLLSPFIFFYQLLLSFFSYADLIKRDPSSLGMRKWSLYSRLYLRHYNELEHEFNARLARAYKPACLYLNCFVSTFASIVAHNIAFFAGSICAVILVLAVIDEDVLQVQNVITLLTGAGILTAISRIFIPDDNFIFCPELLLKSVLAHIHYMPATWRGKAHTSTVHNEFTKFFQLRLVFFMEELLSPIVTPLILLFSFRHNSLQIVDFLRNFSIDVAGVGDVCSFAQLDVHKHGNRDWLDEDDIMPDENEALDTKATSGPSQAMQSEDGKTELSLVNFALTNPNWKPSQASEVFLSNLKGHVRKDANMMISVRNIENSGFIHSMQNSSLFLQPLSIPPAIQESVLENLNSQSHLFHSHVSQVNNMSTHGAQNNLPLKGTGIAAKTGPLHQVSTTSETCASVYVSQKSNYNNQVTCEQSVLALSYPTSANLATSSAVNLSNNDVLVTEVSATVLKLHERFHDNASSQCISSSSSSYQNHQSGQPKRADGAEGKPKSSVKPKVSGDVVTTIEPTSSVTSNFEEFDFTLPPLDTPPESMI